MSALAQVHSQHPSRLEELTGVIRSELEHIERESTAAQRAETNALHHAIRAGEALIEAHEVCPRGEWHDWLASNWPKSKQTAWLYIRIAHHQEKVRAEASRIRDCYEVLAGLHGPFTPWGDRDEEAATVAQSMLDDGHSRRAVARALQVSPTTVERWFEPPDAVAARRAYNRDLKREKRRSSPTFQPALTQLRPVQNEPPDRSHRYGEPGRNAITRAVRQLATAQDKDEVREALQDLAAIATAWANRLH